MKKGRYDGVGCGYNPRGKGQDDGARGGYNPLEMNGTIERRADTIREKWTGRRGEGRIQSARKGAEQRSRGRIQSAEKGRDDGARGEYNPRKGTVRRKKEWELNNILLFSQRFAK